MISGFSTPCRERTCKVWKSSKEKEKPMDLTGIDLGKKKRFCQREDSMFQEGIKNSSQLSRRALHGHNPGHRTTLSLPTYDKKLKWFFFLMECPVFAHHWQHHRFYLMFQ